VCGERGEDVLACAAAAAVSGDVDRSVVGAIPDQVEQTDHSFVIEFAVWVDAAGSHGEPRIGERREMLPAVGARVVLIRAACA
jgi:hypothetical protein